MTSPTPPAPASAADSLVGALLADYYRTKDAGPLVRIVETTPCPPDVTAFLIDSQQPDVDVALLLAAHRDQRITLTSAQTALLQARAQAYASLLQDRLSELDGRTWEDADTVEEEAAVALPLAQAQAALTVTAKPRVTLTSRPISHAPTSRGITG